MQEVSQKWIATNADAFTVRSFVTLQIHRNSNTGTLFVPPDRIMSYSHKFYGDMLSGEIPEISVTAKINNNDGIYTGTLLTESDFEHAKTDILISFEVGDDDPEEEQNETISGGRLYISSIEYDSRDRTITLKLSDCLQFMNAKYNGLKKGWISQIVSDVVSQANDNSILPNTVITCLIDEDQTEKYQVDIDGETTLAETLQVCANASSCVFYVDRSGIIHIEPMSRTIQNYFINRDVQYTEPALTIDKAINSVLVRYHDEASALTEYDYVRKDQIGAQQTVSNPAIFFVFNAMSVARKAYRVLQENRQIISGEFRCDPRVDIFDVIQIESAERKLSIYDLERMPLNTLERMTINELETNTTSIGNYCIISLEMTFTGAWHGRFTARAVDDKNNSDLRTWGNLRALTWGKAREFSWDEVRGGEYT